MIGFITNPMDWVKKLQGRKQIDLLAYFLPKELVASIHYLLIWILEMTSPKSGLIDEWRLSPQDIFTLAHPARFSKPPFHSGMKISENFTQQVVL